MKKFSIFVSSILLLCAFALFANGQTRSRRVGNTAPSTPTPSPTPLDDASPATGSSADEDSPPQNAPVLKGKGSDNAIKKDSQTQKEQPREVGEDEVVRVDTTLVTLPVTVQDREGRYIPNLRKEDFRIYENGVEQEVAYFAATEAPFTVALLIDTSGSTRFKLEEIQDAAIAFVNQLSPNDRVIVISFDDRIRVLSEATNDRYALRSAILNTRGGGGTRFYDAVDFALQKMRGVDGRKAIVLFTDGVDTTSRRSTYEGTLNEAEESDSLFYSLEYDTYEDMDAGGGGGYPYPSRRRGGGGYPPSGGGYPPSGGGYPGGGIGDILGSIILGYPRGGGYPGGGYPGGGGGAGTSRAEYDRADAYLHEIADRTGGRFQAANTIGDINQAFSVIAEELRRQYSLGYYPKQKPTPGERRQIRVRVNRENLVARTRENYIFGQPNQPQQNGKTQTVKNNTQTPQKQGSKGTMQPYIF